MPFRILLQLVFCNLVWSASPAMGKLVLRTFPAAQAAWLRYSSALLAYVIVAAALRIPRPYLKPEKLRHWALLSLLGFSAFCFAALLGMTGLAASRAMENSLIMAMEPLITVFLAWLILREGLSQATAIAFGVALLGFGLLTGLTPAHLAQGLDAHLVGNLAILLSLLGEATYSLAARSMIQNFPPAAVFGSALVLGLGFLTVCTAGLAGLPGLQALLHMPWQSAVGILWLGPLATSLCYFMWMKALGKATVANVALTLFIQPLLGPVWGAIFLGERLSSVQLAGCALILLAVFGQTLVEQRSRRGA